jgi:hypothetical protein
MTTPNPNACVLWSRPLPQCNFSNYLLKRLKDAGVQVDLRIVDNFTWKWRDFEAASPDWSILPVIYRSDGVRVNNYKELEEWIGRDPALDNPRPTPMVPK